MKNLPIYVLVIFSCSISKSFAQGDTLSKVEARNIITNRLLAEQVIAFRLVCNLSQQNARTDLGENGFGYEVKFDQLDFDSGHCIYNYRFRAPEAGYYHIDLRFEVEYYVESIAVDEDCEGCIPGFVDREREILLYEQKGSREIFKIHSKLLQVSQQVGSHYPFAYSTIIKLEKGAVLVPFFNDGANYSFASFSGFKIY